MKFLKHMVLVIGMMLLLPVVANASPDDFDDITVEAVELDDNSSDSVTHDVEIPHAEDMDEHHGRGHDEHENEQEHENEHGADDDHDQLEDSPGEDVEDGHDDHAETSSDESVS